MGAKVIKVEAPGQGDYLKEMQSTLYRVLNRGKKNIKLDLKSPKDQKKFTALVKKCDVLLESFRPGVMDKLGFSFQRLKKSNPKIILASITGFGQQGTYRDKAGHDLNYMSLSGLLNPPVIPTMQWADYVGGGMMGVIPILAALQGKKRKACHLDISITDSMKICGLGAQALAIAGEDISILTGKVGRYQIYETADGRFVALAALEEKFWKNFCKVVGRPVESENIADLQKLFKTKTRDEWEKLGKKHDICLTPVLTPKEI